MAYADEVAHIFDAEGLKQQGNQNYGAPPAPAVTPYTAAPVAPQDYSKVFADYNAFQDQQLQQQQAAAQLNYQLQNQGNNLQTQNLQNMANSQLGSNAIQQQQNQTDIAALNRQSGYLSNLSGIQGQRDTLDRTLLDQMHGLSGKQNTLDINLLNAQHDITNQQYSVQQGGTQRSIQTLGDLFNLQKQKFGIDQSSLERQKQYASDSYANQFPSFQLQQQDVGDQEEQAQHQALRDRQAAISAATTRGALMSVGHARNLEDVDLTLSWRMRALERQKSQIDINEKQFIKDYQEKTAQIQDDIYRGRISSQEASVQYSDQLGQLQDNLKMIDLARQDEQAKYTNQYGTLDLSRQAEQNKYTAQTQGLSLDQQQHNAEAAEQQAKVQDQLRQADLVGQQLGIDRTEVLNRLDYGIQQVGLQGQVNSMQLLQAQVDLQNGRFNPLQETLQAVLQAGSLLP